MPLIGLCFSIIKAIFKTVLKILWWIGAYWLLICMSPVFLYEWIAPAWAKSHGGTFFGIHTNRWGNILAPAWLYYVTFALTIIFMALTIYQNARRMITRDQTYNVFQAIFSLISGNGSSKKNGIKKIAKHEEGKPDIVRLVTAQDIRGGFLFGKESNGVDDNGNAKRPPARARYVMQPQETDGHVLIIGAPGTGKTASIALPTLLSWKSRVFAIDIKGELYQKTKNVRKEIKAFNPTDRSAYGYDPYYLLRTTDNISSSAKQLALCICPLSAEVKDPYWIKSAQNMLTGFIIYYFHQGLNFAESMMKIKSQSALDLVSIIMADNDVQAKMEVSQFDGMNEKTLAGIFTELSNSITVFATDEDLQQALSGERECITPEDLEQGYDVYCCIPEEKLDEWSSLMSMMCNQFLKAFERRKEENNTPILFLIDEFARLGKIQSVSQALGTLRSKKIHIALIIQSISQLNAIYGKDVADVIEDNCTYKAILFAGGSETQEWCSKLVGTYEKAKNTSNYNANVAGIGKGMGTSKTTEDKRIIKPEDFAKLPAQNQLVYLFPGGAARLDKIIYWQDKTFEGLMKVGDSFEEKETPAVVSE